MDTQTGAGLIARALFLTSENEAMADDIPVECVVLDDCVINRKNRKRGDKLEVEGAVFRELSNCVSPLVCLPEEFKAPAAQRSVTPAPK